MVLLSLGSYHGNESVTAQVTCAFVIFLICLHFPSGPEANAGAQACGLQAHVYIWDLRAISNADIHIRPITSVTKAPWITTHIQKATILCHKACASNLARERSTAYFDFKNLQHECCRAHNQYLKHLLDPDSENDHNNRRQEHIGIASILKG